MDKGHAVFIDVNSITIGDPWARSIEKNISDCDIFVVILTPDSLTSPHVEKEVLQAQSENKIIVPCIHEYVNYNEIKWGLEKIQGIEFSDKFDLALNIYPKIKNYKNVVNEKPSSISQQKPIQDTNISEDIYGLNKKGSFLYDQGKYQEAIDCYDKALRVNPNNKYALNGKGIALNSQGKYQEAIEYYDKALRVNPNYFEALYNKGFALKKIGKYQEAIEYYDKTLVIDPNHVYALNGKGLALYDQGKYQEAIEYYDKTLVIDPNQVDALNNKGSSLYDQGKYQEAIEYYDKTLVIDPNFTIAQDNKKLALEELAKLYR